MQWLQRVADYWIKSEKVSIASVKKSLAAQEYTVSVQQFGIEEGLAHRVVSKVYKDKNGFLWIFGYTEPLRYDGHAFKPFSLKAPPVEVV